VVIVVLSAVSITPATKLKAEAPADFIALRADGNAPDAALAAHYWKIASGVIQWKYNRASALPEQVPADFVLVANSGKPLTMPEQAARAAYWAKLREEWLVPENWHTAYTFDGNWALRSIQFFSNEVMRFIHQT
jgi:hypothetical protein